jgi:hypothetical protein
MQPDDCGHQQERFRVTPPADDITIRPDGSFYVTNTAAL